MSGIQAPLEIAEAPVLCRWHTHTHTHCEKAPRIAALPHPLHSTTQLAALWTHTSKHTYCCCITHIPVIADLSHTYFSADTETHRGNLSPLPKTHGYISPPPHYTSQTFLPLVWFGAKCSLLPSPHQWTIRVQPQRTPQLIPQLFGVGSGQPKHWNSLRPLQLQHRSDINLSTELAGRSAGWLVGTEPGGRGESATQTAKSGEPAKQAAGVFSCREPQLWLL